MGIGQELCGLGLFLGAKAIAAQLMYALRCEAQVALHGYAGCDNGANGVDNLGTAFQLQSIGTRLFHDANGIANSLLTTHLIGAERHIAHHQTVVAGANHATGINNHFIDGDGQRRLIAGHHVGGGVAHENRIDAGTVQNARGGEVIRSELGYLLTSGFHLCKCLCCNLFLVCC